MTLWSQGEYRCSGATAIPRHDGVPPQGRDRRPDTWEESAATVATGIRPAVAVRVVMASQWVSSWGVADDAVRHQQHRPGDVLESPFVPQGGVRQLLDLPVPVDPVGDVGGLRGVEEVEAGELFSHDQKIDQYHAEVRETADVELLRTQRVVEYFGIFIRPV